MSNVTLMKPRLQHKAGCPLSAQAVPVKRTWDRFVAAEFGENAY